MRNKMTAFVVLVTVLATIGGCLTPDNNQGFDWDIQYLTDQTDSNANPGDSHGFISWLNVAEMFMDAYRIEVGRITDQDYPTRHVETLSRQDPLMSKRIRQAHAGAFAEKIVRIIDGISELDTTEIGNSVILRQVLFSMEGMADRNSEYKYIVVQGDMIENEDDLNFYSKKTQQKLEMEIDNLINQFDSLVPPNVKGINFIILYKPTSYKDNVRFRSIVKFYERLFMPHGVHIIVNSNFANLTPLHPDGDN